MNTTKIRIMAAAMAAVAAPAAALAEAAGDDPFSGMEIVGQAQLGDMRGGMMINGIPVDFAIIIRTTVEGALAANGLQTTLTVNDAGGLAGATTTALGTDGTVDAGGGGGMAMTLADGGTSIFHQVIDGQIQTLIANRTDNVTISHQTQVNVTMPGFYDMAQGYSAHTRASQLGQEAMVVGLGRF